VSPTKKEELLGLGGVLHAVAAPRRCPSPCLLDHGLFDPQLVEAFVQSLDVSVVSAIPACASSAPRADRCDEGAARPQAGIAEQQVRYLLADDRARLVGVSASRKSGSHGCRPRARCGGTHVLCRATASECPLRGPSPACRSPRAYPLHRKCNAPAEVQARGTWDAAESRRAHLGALGTG